MCKSLASAWHVVITINLGFIITVSHLRFVCKE